MAGIDQNTFDLSVKNPNGGEVVAHRSPQEIMDEISALDVESAEVLAYIRTLAMKAGWQMKVLGELCVGIQDGAHESPKRQFDHPGPGRFLCITSKNIRNNFVDLGNVSYVDVEFPKRIYPRCKPAVWVMCFLQKTAQIPEMYRSIRFMSHLVCCRAFV